MSVQLLRSLSWGLLLVAVGLCGVSSAQETSDPNAELL